MINSILTVQIAVCLLFSLVCWLIYFQLDKIQITLDQLDLQIKKFSQKVDLAKHYAGKLSSNYLLNEIILTPATLFVLFEIIVLTKSKQLNKQNLLKLFLKKNN